MTSTFAPVQWGSVWSKTLASLQGQMTKATFNTQFVGSEPRGYDPMANELVIEVVSKYAAEWITARLYDTVSRNVMAHAGKEVNLLFVEQGGFPFPAHLTAEPEWNAEPAPAPTGNSEQAIGKAWRDAFPAMVKSVADKTAGAGRSFLDGATVGEMSGQSLTVCTLTASAAKWLNMNTIRPNLEKILSAAAGTPLSLVFTAAPPASWEASVVEQIGKQEVGARTLGKASGDDKAGKGETTAEGKTEEIDPNAPVQVRLVGADPTNAYMQLSHYASRFWRPYLGQSAFACWELLCSFGYYANRYNNDWPNVEQLAEHMGQGDRYTLLGRMRKDPATGEKKVQGGVLQKLVDASLVHHVLVIDAERPTLTQHRFSVLDALPILTPAQVGTLSTRLQDAHATFIAHYKAFPRDKWAASTEESFIVAGWLSHD